MIAKQIKVLHIGSSHLMGLTNQKTQLALAYKGLNNLDVTVLSGENEQVSGCFQTLSKAGVPYHVIQGFDEHHDFLRLVREFSSIIKTVRPDVVTVNTNWQLAIVGAARLFKRGRFRTIYTVHGFRHNHPVKSVFARVLIGFLLWLFADAIIAPTNYVRDKFSPLRKRIVSIPLGEDDVFFQSIATPDFKQPWRICFPGQFRVGKNQAMLIEALAEYIGKTGDARIELILPGEGELLAVAKSLARDLNVAKQVMFPGQLDRLGMADIYRKCQIAVIPTNSETFGHCIAEPLVMRRVVVSRPIGVALDVIDHGVNGFLFKDKAELIDLLIDLRRMDVADLARIATNAGLVAEQFRWINIARKHVNLLMRPLLGL